MSSSASRATLVVCVISLAFGALLASAAAQDAAKSPAKNSGVAQELGEKTKTFQTQTNRKSSTNGVTGARATTAAPLTAGECERLGGSVVKTNIAICMLQEMCVRTDQYGVTHRHCITELGDR